MKKETSKSEKAVEKKNEKSSASRKVSAKKTSAVSVRKAKANDESNEKKAEKTSAKDIKKPMVKKASERVRQDVQKTPEASEVSVSEKSGKPTPARTEGALILQPVTKTVEAPVSGYQNAKRNRRRNRNKNKNQQGEGGDSNQVNVASLDQKKVHKLAWKIFLQEVTEEGLALMDDLTSREAARRAFRVAEIFLTEDARRKHVAKHQHQQSSRHDDGVHEDAEPTEQH